jgi:nitrogen-specific signal transduction histidine kinase
LTRVRLKERDRLRGLIDRLASQTADKNLVLFSGHHILILPTQHCSALITASHRYTPA